MEKAKEEKIILDIRERLTREYENSPALQERFKSLALYLENKVNESFFEAEYDRLSQDQKAEFLNDRAVFIHYMLAVQGGLVKIIGGVSVKA